MKFKIALPLTAAALALGACSHHDDTNSTDATNMDAGMNTTDGNMMGGDTNAAMPMSNGTDSNMMGSASGTGTGSMGSAGTGTTGATGGTGGTGAMSGSTGAMSGGTGAGTSTDTGSRSGTGAASGTGATSGTSANGTPTAKNGGPDNSNAH